MVVTLSGIFRDLLPLQIKLLAEAALLAAAADEPAEQNFVRKHALAFQAEHGCDLETAALRVFGNADGAYGSNVNHLIEQRPLGRRGRTRRDLYAAQELRLRRRRPARCSRRGCWHSVLADVDLAYQNLDSVELGVTTVDHYFDTLGGISRAVRRAKGGTSAPVYIGDQTRGDGTVRTLVRTGGAGNPHPHAQSEMVRGHARSTATKACARSKRTSPTHGLVGDHGRGRALGLPAAHRDLRAGSRDARAAGGAQSGGLGEDRQPADRGARAQILVAGPRRCCEALRRAGEELEDRLEGVVEGVAA